LQVQDDIGRVFYHARDRLELVQYAFDLDSGYGGSLDRNHAHAAQSVPDGGAETALKRLRPEHAVLIGKSGSIGGEAFWFLKALPKHVFLLRPFWLNADVLGWPEPSQMSAEADLARKWTTKLFVGL